MKIKKIVVSSILAGTLLCPAAELELTGKTDKADALYRTGDTALFEFCVKDSSGYPQKNVLLKIHYEGDRKAVFGKSSVLTDENGCAKVSVELTRPGFVRCRAEIADRAGKTFCWLGVGAEPEKIQAARKAPADFDEFWSRRKQAVDRIDLKQVKMKKLSAEGSSLEEFDVEIPMPSGMPVRGILSYPREAKSKSLPAVGCYQGAGIYPAGSPKWVSRRGFLAFEINAHGLPNDRPAQFYKDLQSGKILEFEKLKPGILKNRNYAFNDPDALERETNYFVGMFERVYMSLRFLKSLPQWDRKNLAVVGTSQGGAQAIAGGGLESAVTCVVAHVPALGDHGANFAGRDNGWPKFTHQKIVKVQPDGIQKMLRAVDYVDTAFFAARINPEAAFFVSTGLFDNSAHSSSVAAEFNSFRGKNKEFVIVQSGHRIPEKVNTAGLRFLKNNTKITKE